MRVGLFFVTENMLYDHEDAGLKYRITYKNALCPEKKGLHF